jgi:hypothetical protein
LLAIERSISALEQSVANNKGELQADLDALRQAAAHHASGHDGAHGQMVAALESLRDRTSSVESLYQQLAGVVNDLAKPPPVATTRELVLEQLVEAVRQRDRGPFGDRGRAPADPNMAIGTGHHYAADNGGGVVVNKNSLLPVDGGLDYWHLHAVSDPSCDDPTAFDPIVQFGAPLRTLAAAPGSLAYPLPRPQIGCRAGSFWSRP